MRLSHQFQALFLPILCLDFLQIMQQVDREQITNKAQNCRISAETVFRFEYQNPAKHFVKNYHSRLIHASFPLFSKLKDTIQPHGPLSVSCKNAIVM